MCTPCLIGSVVFSNTGSCPGVLKTLAIITGNNPVWPSTRGLEDRRGYEAMRGSAYNPPPDRRAKVELRSCFKTPGPVVSNNWDGTLELPNSKKIKRRHNSMIDIFMRKSALVRILKQLLRHFLVPIKRQIQMLILRLSISHLYGPRRINHTAEELIVLSVVRNGELYMKSFIEHYISLGVKHIVFLDNRSTDRTVAIAQHYSQVTILQTKCPYKRYETLMKIYLVKRFSKKRWNLFADIDEFFDYPYSDRFTLSQLLRYLNQYSYTAVVSQMLDLFSDQELQTLSNDWNQDIKQSFTYYDISDIEKTAYVWGFVSNPAIKMHWGGIRKTLFGTYNGLTKAALTFIDNQIEPFVDYHHAGKASIADFSTVLFHYPFTCSFPVKVYEAVQTNRYALSASDEYEMYWRRIQQEPILKIPTDNASILNNVNDLVSEGFLIVSPNYTGWISEYNREGRRLQN
jgi:Glycosyl transferase family 2